LLPLLNRTGRQNMMDKLMDWYTGSKIRKAKATHRNKTKKGTYSLLPISR